MNSAVQSIDWAFRWLAITFAFTSLAACVPNVSKEFTKSNRDEKTLLTNAFIRPKWPNPMVPEEGRKFVQTDVRPSSSDHGVRISLSDLTNLGFVVDPGPCSVSVSSGKPPYVAYGRLDFLAKAGTIYRFRARIDESRGFSSTHYWELYEEGSGKVILKKQVAPPYRPLMLPVYIAN